MRTIKAIAIALGISVVLTLSAEAAQTDFGNNNFGPEMKIPLGARPAAMGAAFAGLADDFNANAWNPAGLAQIKDYQGGFLHDIYFQNISMEYLTYAQRVSAGAGLGAYVEIFNYGSLEKTTEVNGMPEQAGTFTPTSLGAGLSYGQWVSEKLAVGGVLKLFNQSIDNQSFTALAADLGGLYRVGKELQLGLVLQNLGTPVSGSSLPMNVKVGAMYSLPITIPKDSWKLLADVNAPLGSMQYASLNVGTEYSYQQFLAGRLGYVIKDSGDLGGLTGVTAGLGVKFQLLQLDYALVTYGNLGMTHQIMLSANFGATDPTEPSAPASSEAKEKVVYRDNPVDAQAQAKIQELEAQKQALERQLAKFEKDIEVGTLKPILFETDQSTLLTSAYETLDTLEKILAQYQELVVRVEGHTDDVGTDAHNLKLSQARAETVCKYLAAKTAIKATHLIPIGYGKTQPIVKETDKEARAKNRRVEFIVINPYAK